MSNVSTTAINWFDEKNPAWTSICGLLNYLELEGWTFFPSTGILRKTGVMIDLADVVKECQTKADVVDKILYVCNKYR